MYFSVGLMTELSDIRHMLETYSVDLKELKHHFDADKTVALSSMNTEKMFKLAKHYGTDGR